MNLNVVIILLFSFISFSVYSQDASSGSTGNLRKGLVYNGSTHQPLEGVNIFFHKDSVGIGVTDKNGNFETGRLEKLMGSDSIVFSYVGYRTVKRTIQQLKQDNYRVYLYEQSQSLSEVTVTAEERPYYLDYTTMSPLPVPLYSFGSFVSDGKVYVVAGDETKVHMSHTGDGVEAWEFRSSKMHIYDIATDSWTTQEKPAFAPRACHIAQLYKNRIFVLGGKRYSTNRKQELTDATLEIYDLAKDTLYVDPVNPHQAVNFTSVVYDNCLYAIGGSVKERVYADKIHALDLKTGCWYAMGVVPEECRREMNGILAGHTVYFVGGRRSTQMWRMDSYDLLTGKWTQLTDLKVGVSHPALATHGDLIYIYENNALQVYNLRTNSLMAYPINLGLEGAGMFYWEDKLYIVGGCLREGMYVSPQKDVYCVDALNL